MTWQLTEAGHLRLEGSQPTRDLLIVIFIQRYPAIAPM
jgi:hypothetical protein